MGKMRSVRKGTPRRNEIYPLELGFYRLEYAFHTAKQHVVDQNPDCGHSSAGRHRTNSEGALACVREMTGWWCGGCVRLLGAEGWAQVGSAGASLSEGKFIVARLALHSRLRQSGSASRGSGEPKAEALGYRDGARAKCFAGDGRQVGSLRALRFTPAFAEGCGSATRCLWHG